MHEKDLLEETRASLTRALEEIVNLSADVDDLSNELETERRKFKAENAALLEQRNRAETHCKTAIDATHELIVEREKLQARVNDLEKCLWATMEAIDIGVVALDELPKRVTEAVAEAGAVRTSLDSTLCVVPRETVKRVDKAGQAAAEWMNLNGCCDGDGADGQETHESKCRAGRLINALALLEAAK